MVNISGLWNALIIGEKCINQTFQASGFNPATHLGPGQGTVLLFYVHAATVWEQAS